MASACSKKEPPKEVVPVQKTEEASEQARQIHEMRKRLIIDEGAMEVTALNHGSAQEVLAKLERTFEALQIHNRIPDAPQSEALQTALVAYSKKIGLTLTSFVSQSSGSAERPVPEQIVGPGRHEYKDEELRGVLTLEFVLAPLDIGKLDVWMKRMPVELSRMVRVRSAKGQKGGLRIQAEAYWFYPAVYPRHIPTESTLEGYFKAAGMDQPLEKIRSVVPPARFEQLEALHKKLLSHRSGAEKTLTAYSKANFYESQLAFFETTAKVIEANRMVHVLR